MSDPTVAPFAVWWGVVGCLQSLTVLDLAHLTLGLVSAVGPILIGVAHVRRLKMDELEAERRHRIEDAEKSREDRRRGKDGGAKSTFPTA